MALNVPAASGVPHAVHVFAHGPHSLGLAREAARTASPNSGWPMGALALSLDVRLRKPEVYVLNSTGSAPSDANVATAIHRTNLTAWAFALVVGVGMAFWSLRAHG